MMHLFDTHCHLDLIPLQKNIQKEIDQNCIYTISMTNLPDLFRKEQGRYNSQFIRLALGMHPELVADYTHQIPLMWQLLPQSRYIGEVGLDFTDKRNQKIQTDFFETLVEKCYEEQGKIISIHSRNASKEVLAILGSSFKFKPILHWFSGPKSDLINAVDQGCFISINTAMLRSKRFLSMLDVIPRERILLETDCPFNSIQVSYSKMLETSVSRLADLFQLDVEVMDCLLWENFKKILGAQ